jgi:hypothetical protein
MSNIVNTLVPTEVLDNELMKLVPYTEHSSVKNPYNELQVRIQNMPVTGLSPVKRSRYNKKGSSREYKIEQRDKRKTKLKNSLKKIIEIESNNFSSIGYYFHNGRFINNKTIKRMFRNKETTDILYFYTHKPSFKYFLDRGYIYPKFKKRLDEMTYEYTLWKSETDVLDIIPSEFTELNYSILKLGTEEEVEDCILRYCYPKFYMKKYSYKVF